MARCGVDSRRACERLIEEGKVSVNGKIVTTLGITIRPGIDRVDVCGKIIKPPEDLVYVILNKPSGYVTTLVDTHDRPTVMDLLGGLDERVYPVGRLDMDTTGLLLFTNDGELSFRLTHPKFQVEKEYEAFVEGIPDSNALETFEKGIELEDGMTAPTKVKLLDDSNGRALLSIIIREGRKRQIKRMCLAIGHPVINLTRVKFGTLSIEGLEEGEFRNLEKKEVDSLLKLVGLPCEGRTKDDNSSRRRSSRPDGRREGGRSRRRSAPYGEERTRRKKTRNNRQR